MWSYIQPPLDFLILMRSHWPSRRREGALQSYSSASFRGPTTQRRPQASPRAMSRRRGPAARRCEGRSKDRRALRILGQPRGRRRVSREHYGSRRTPGQPRGALKGVQGPLGPGTPRTVRSSPKDRRAPRIQEPGNPRGHFGGAKGVWGLSARGHPSTARRAKSTGGPSVPAEWTKTREVHHNPKAML